MLLLCALVAGCASPGIERLKGGTPIAPPRPEPTTVAEIQEWCEFGLESLSEQARRSASVNCRDTLQRAVSARRAECRRLVAEWERPLPRLRTSAEQRDRRVEREKRQADCVTGGQDFASTMLAARQHAAFRQIKDNQGFGDFIQRHGSNDPAGIVAEARERYAQACGSGVTLAATAAEARAWLDRFERVGPNLCVPQQQMAQRVLRLEQLRQADGHLDRLRELIANARPDDPDGIAPKAQARVKAIEEDFFRLIASAAATAPGLAAVDQRLASLGQPTVPMAQARAVLAARVLGLKALSEDFGRVLAAAPASEAPELKQAMEGLIERQYAEHLASSTATPASALEAMGWLESAGLVSAASLSMLVDATRAATDWRLQWRVLKVLESSGQPATANDLQATVRQRSVAALAQASRQAPALRPLFDAALDEAGALGPANRRWAAEQLQALGAPSCRVMGQPPSGAGTGDDYQFHGRCSDNLQARDGIVVWLHRGVPAAINCLAGGSFSSKAGEFDSCSEFWARLPGYCKVGDYLGQCQAGRAHGIGMRYRAQGWLGSMSHEYTWGMFRDGKADGFARFFSITGCGMAGCAGAATRQTGWFESDAFKFDCASAGECRSKLSGESYTGRFNQPRRVAGDAASNLPRDFDALLAVFEDTGRPDDLRAARDLARTPAQARQLEYTLMRVAGYEKVMRLTAQLRNGNQQAPVSDSVKLLGMLRSVDSRLPVTLSWQLEPDPESMPLRLGSYRVQLRVALKVTANAQTCFGSICSRDKHSRTVARTALATVSAANGYKAAGAIELSLPGASTASFANIFGSVSELDALEPQISIESVTLEP